MALVYADRVKETTTTTGTGTITLAGAVSGFQSFAAIGNGNQVTYFITSGTAWEVNRGTYTLSGTTLTRGTPIASSNGGALISLSGTSTVAGCWSSKEATANADGWLGTLTANNTSGSLHFDSSVVNNSYPLYEFQLVSLVPASADLARARFGQSGSSITSGYEVSGITNNSATNTITGASSNAALGIPSASLSNVAANGGLNGYVRLFNPAASIVHTAEAKFSFYNGTSQFVSYMSASWNGNSNPITDFFLEMNTGNWVSGQLIARGYKS